MSNKKKAEAELKEAQDDFIEMTAELLDGKKIDDAEFRRLKTMVLHRGCNMDQIRGIHEQIKRAYEVD